MLVVILTEVETFVVIGFHFPVENYILQENISGYPFGLDVQMKKIHVVKSFSHSTGFTECPLFKVQVLFIWGKTEMNKAKSKIRYTPRSLGIHT